MCKDVHADAVHGKRAAEQWSGLRQWCACHKARGEGDMAFIHTKEVAGAVPTDAGTAAQDDTTYKPAVPRGTVAC